MRQVDAAERTVPIATVALAPIKLEAGLIDQLALSTALEGFLQSAADHVHASVHRIGFRVLHLEVPPIAAPHEGGNSRPLALPFQVAVHVLKFVDPSRGQCPLGHFSVAALGDIEFAQGRHLFDRFAGRGDFEPIAVGHECVEKLCEPAPIVNVLFRAGPVAKFFAVVAKHDHGAWVCFGHRPQVIDRILGLLKRNHIPQSFAAGQHIEDLGVVLGHVVAVQLLAREPGILEVEVVEHRVADPRLDQIAGERLFPNALGDPHAADFCAEPSFEPFGIGGDLSDAIARRDHRQDRFKIGPADDFDPT